MRRALLLLTSIIATSGCGACGAEAYSISAEEAKTYAEARCAAVGSCCDPPPPADCVTSRTDALMRLEDLTDSPLHLSETCMRDVLAWATKEDGISCATPLALKSPECQLAHGEREKGENCITFGDLGFFGTDCAEGLDCRAGRCASGPWVTFEAPLGDPCNIEGWTCVSGAYCSAAGICEPGVTAGGACAHPRACIPPAEYFCSDPDGAGVCAERPTLGEPCDESLDPCAFQCGDHGCEKLRCADGVCALRLPAACEDTSTST